MICSCELTQKGYLLADNCGGLISLQNETILSYANDGSQNAEQLCVWIVTGTNNGVLGYMLLEQKFGNEHGVLTITQVQSTKSL